MSLTESVTSAEQLPWREVHHLAFATQDLDATVRFYTELLGMYAEAIKPPNPIHGRTCTICPRVNATVALHFFEQADAQALPPHPELLQRLTFPSVGVHHIGLTLADAAAGHRLQERLQSKGIAMTPVMDQGDVYNMLFFDNNSLLLEANWPKA